MFGGSTVFARLDEHDIYMDKRSVRYCTATHIADARFPLPYPGQHSASLDDCAGQSSPVQSH